MCLRMLLAVLFVTTASAQVWQPPVEPRKAPAVLVAVSPDGLTAAVARSEGGAAKRFGRVELWNTTSGKLQRTITGFDGPIWSLTFAPDNKSVITLSTEFHETKIQTSVKDRNDEKVFAELKWWNIETGEFIRKIPVGTEGVDSVEAAWSPTGDSVALIERYLERQLTQVDERGAFNQRITRPGVTNVAVMELKLLDPQTGRKKIKLDDASRTSRGRLKALSARLEDPVFSPDGKLLAAVADDEVQLWSVESGKKFFTFKKLFGTPAAIAFSADNRLIALASVKGKMPGGESEITLWEVATGKELSSLKGRNDEIECLQFAANGRALIIGSLQYNPEGPMGTVKMWDLNRNRLGRFDVREGEAVSSLTLLPEQGAVVLQSGSEVEVRDSSTLKIRYSFEPTQADDDESTRHSRFLLSAKRAVAVAFSPDGTIVSAQIPGEGIRRWDARTGGAKDPIAAEKLSEAVVAVSPNAEFFAEITDQGMRITDRVNGTTKMVPLPPPGPNSPFALSDDGRNLASADDSGAIQLWDVATGKTRGTINAGQKVTALALDRAGQLLASAQADHSVTLWDLKTGASVGELRKHEDVVNALVFSPDGQTLASGGDDRTAVLWDVSSRKSKRTLKGHDLTVTSLAFSPDGLTLASGSGNASVVLWNVTTGKLDRILR